MGNILNYEMVVVIIIIYNSDSNPNQILFIGNNATRAGVDLDNGNFITTMEIIEHHIIMVAFVVVITV